MEGGERGGKEGVREWWCWASRFCSRVVVRVGGCLHLWVVVCICGQSFLFIAGVIVSWALIISEWGVVVSWALVISEWGSLSSVGDHRCPWALSFVGAVVVHGAGRCRLGARSLFVGLGYRLWVPCHCWWVLGVVEGRLAVVWG